MVLRQPGFILPDDMATHTGYRYKIFYSESERSVNWMEASPVKELIIRICKERYGRSGTEAQLNSSGYNNKTTVALS